MTGLIKKRLKIIGMHCTSCAMNIDFDLEDLPEVKSAKTSYAKAETEIEFLENEVNLEKILSTIEKTGYKAEFLEN